jgi:RNA polymerase sigma-70 factor (ECF subfamily)
MTGENVRPGEATGSTSWSLLERVKAQDQAAWGRLVELYNPLVYGWCRRAGLQAADAADLGQEVFQAVARKIADFRRDPAGGSFRGWLRVITHNKLRDFIRARQARASAAGGSDAYELLMQIPADGPEESAEEATEASLLYQRALELLRTEFEERSWQAFWRVVVEGQWPEDVARDLQMSVNAVYLAKSRILRRLRLEFADLIEV